MLTERVAIDERLTLEPIGPQHIVAGTAMIDRSRAELIPWMPWAEASDEAAYRAFVARVEAQRACGGPDGTAYAILVDGAFAGCVDLHDAIPGARSASIGYWLGTPYTGHGWMTRSVVALAAIGFRIYGLRRIHIYADVDNVRSRRVAERAGFTFASIRPSPADAHRGRHEAVYERLAPA
jgi:ribosomal-protein-serine acetyltransferase